MIPDPVELHGRLLSATAWLYTVLVQGPFFFLDLWSVAHAWSGAVLTWALLERRVRAPAAWVLAALLAYETLEISLVAFGVGVFRPEILPDQATDVAVGGLGGLAAWQFRRRRAAGGVPPAGGVSLLAAATVAFWWVGSHGYRYNRDLLNSPGLNWWAALLWTAGLWAGLRVHARLRAGRGAAAALLLGSLACSAGLALAALAGHHVLAIREVPSAASPPPLPGIVHGTSGATLFHVLGLPLAVLAQALLRRLLGAPAPAARRVPSGPDELAAVAVRGAEEG